MRGQAIAVCLALAVLGCQRAAAQQPPAPAAAAAATVDERLVLSTDGSTLSGGSGGGGGSVTWLRNLRADAVIGAGADYQQIANSHWSTGVVSGSLALGQGNPNTHLYAEVHEGAGDIGAHAFHYSLAAAGVLGTLTPRLSVQLEERRIDIDTSHGNLPKLGLSFRVTPQLLATASYAYSLGGNLGTKLTTLRLDYSAKSLSAIAGVVWGPAAPAVFNLIGQVVSPGPSLKEGFAGIGKPVGRTEWLVVGDYQDVGGTKRTTITLACTVHLRARGQPQ
jgi:hypothetical protein